MSNETQFTRGPWCMQYGKDVFGNREWIVRAGPDGIGITTLTYLPRPGVEQEFNAHLIAAAPELYKALNELLTMVELEHDDYNATECVNARAALAKARGEQQ